MDSLVRTCQQCGASFVIPSGRSWAARYCSASCQARAKSTRQNIRRRGELTYRTCRGCEVSFQPTNTRNVWCSPSCRHTNSHAKRAVAAAKLRCENKCAHCWGPIGETRTRNAVFCRDCVKPAARKKAKSCRSCGEKLEGRSRVWCRDCKEATKHARGRAALYGISYEKYQDIVGRAACDICQTPLVEKMSDANEYRDVGHIDHDHATGAVRGYLCRMCNHMIGNAKDMPELLEAGAAYLRLIGEDR
jgi:hypothetical protein